MRISDWSSDVCSSDLVRAGSGPATQETGYSAHGALVLRTAIFARPLIRQQPSGRKLSLLLATSRAKVPPAESAGTAESERSLDSATTMPAARPLAFYIHRSEEHTSELQSLMRISYDVFCLKK